MKTEEEKGTYWKTYPVFHLSAPPPVADLRATQVEPEPPLVGACLGLRSHQSLLVDARSGSRPQWT
jgi:hypothetical protein